MNLAVISDIHADIRALEAVLADADTHGADAFLCLGDVVGYGTEPQACVDLLRARGIPTVRGNHDALAARPFDATRPCALPRIDLARRELTDDAKMWLRELPLLRQPFGVTAVHASLPDPDAWRMLDNSDAAIACFARLHTEVCFYGHTHEWGYWSSNPPIWHAQFRSEYCTGGSRVLINPGCVEHEARYALFNCVTRNVQFLCALVT